jgi:hypothetical protein
VSDLVDAGFDSIPAQVSIPATLLRERQGTTGRSNLAIEIHQVIFTECSLPSVSTMCLQKCVRDAATLCY